MSEIILDKIIYNQHHTAPWSITIQPPDYLSPYTFTRSKLSHILLVAQDIMEQYPAIKISNYEHYLDVYKESIK